MITFNAVVKYFFKYILSFLKAILYLDKLNKNEESGKISKITKFKFIPKSKINVPFSLGRSIRGLPFKDNLKKDPFGVFINNIFQEIDKDRNIEYLFTHFKKEKVSNAGKVVGLKSNLNLKKYPAWALVMPWEKISIEKKYKNYHKLFIKNRSKYNANIKQQKHLKLEDFFYSYDYADSQYIQSKQLLENIKKNRLRSFKYNDSPKVYILIDNNEWRWCMSGEGNHRAYISSILGHKSFECVIDGIVDKKNISKCYNVKNGLYTSTEAKTIFNHFFSGDKCLRGLA
tara:strand:- start:1805 stop:2662 length:858 start_codon:yes stop_codon:yes gene_type:complete